MIEAQSRGPARVISRTLMYLILLVSALLAVLPFYWTVAGSLMTPVELYSQIPHLWPAKPDFSSYSRIFEMVPYQSRVIPLFVMFNNYGLFNSYAGIVLPGLASAFGLFMMTQFFKSVPPELREAALIDGAGELRIFFRIYLPLARPAVATLALLMFLQSWDQLLWPLIIAPRPDMRTLQVGLAFITQYAPTLNYQMAAIVISVIPVVVAFFLAQRQFVEGIAAGAVKQ